MILYFARHGESEANVGRTFSNRDLPHHLTPGGLEHARDLAARFQGLRVSALWCSPVPRAVETATIVGKALSLPFQISEGLREFDVGRYEGTSAGEGWQEYADVVRAWREGDHERRVGGGESLTEIVARLRALIDALIAGALSGYPTTPRGQSPTLAPRERRIGLIAHGGLYFAALPHVFSNVTPEFAFANTRGYGLLITGEVRDGRLVCVEWDGRPPPD